MTVLHKIAVKEEVSFPPMREEGSLVSLVNK